ncbi:MAG: hypothetical protein ACK587_08235 [Cyanobacteriota bacterium]
MAKAHTQWLLAVRAVESKPMAAGWQQRWGIIQPPAVLALMGVASLIALLGDASRLDAVAQELPSANQPLAIDGDAALVPSSCPLVVPPGQSVLQPLKIRPDQVPLKNRLGCLSPADALYGPDGCPVRLCGPTQGVFPLTPP